MRNRPEFEIREIIPNAMVRSCADCCRMTTADGRPNVVGELHRASLTKTFGTPGEPGYAEWLDCSRCPVHILSREKIYRDGNGKPILDASGRPMTEFEVVCLGMDGSE